MRKSTLFISAVLTTFVMAMLAGVASAYQGVIASTPTATAQAQEQPEVKAISHTTDAQAVNLTPEEAAGLAAQVLGQNDLYSVEVTDLNGETVFMVTFSNGKLVYVSLDGQIRSIGEVPVETVVVNSGGNNNRKNRQTQTTTSNQSSSQHQENESHDNHEEHDD